MPHYLISSMTCINHYPVQSFIIPLACSCKPDFIWCSSKLWFVARSKPGFTWSLLEALVHGLKQTRLHLTI